MRGQGATVTKLEPPTPPDPITILGEAAAQLHELYCSYIGAGFTEQQALYLVGQIITATIRKGEA
jgi:hypothetical protein